MISVLAFSLVPAALATVSGINPNKPPYQSQAGHGQFGWNNCSTTADPKSKCQDLWIESLDDFCLFAPPKTATVGSIEEDVVAYCLTANHGTRLLPKNIITSATMIKTAQYIQIKGTLSDQTLLHIPKGDYGGEFDPHGYNGYGNPIGGLVFAKDPKESGDLTQVVEWVHFIGNDQFCIRACYNSGDHPYQECMHIYDEMGCDFVMPEKTPAKTFQTCKGAVDKPAGIYETTLKNGQVSTSTFTEGQHPTPSARKPAKTSDCVKQASLTYHTYPTTKKSKKGAAHAERALPTGHAKMERHVREEDL